MTDSITIAELRALPIGSVVMTETDPETFGAYEQRIWQRFGGEPEWQFGMRRHDWQSTDGGFIRMGNFDLDNSPFGWNRRITVIFNPNERQAT